MTMNRVPDIGKAIRMLNDAVNRRLPILISNAAERHFKASFRNQGFINNILIPWRRTQKKKSIKLGGKSRGILISTSALVKSIRVELANASEIKIVAGNERVKYAKAHNEGFKGTVKVAAHMRKLYTKRKEGTGIYSIKTKRERQQTVSQQSGNAQVKEHSRKMDLPKRQFMGQSAQLSRQIDNIIIKELKRIERECFKNT